MSSLALFFFSSFLFPSARESAWGTYYRRDKISWTLDGPSREVIIGGEQVIDRQETSGRGVRGICRVVVERTFGHGAWWRGLERAKEAGARRGCAESSHHHKLAF